MKTLATRSGQVICKREVLEKPSLGSSGRTNNMLLEPAMANTTHTANRGRGDKMHVKTSQALAHSNCFVSTYQWFFL
jgi:hypothetical protein